MEPSKEAIKAVRSALYEVDFAKKYDTPKLLEIAYAIDVAPLEKRLEEARNAALEEAAQLFDNLVRSSNWNPADLDFFAVKIRALKGE